MSNSKTTGPKLSKGVRMRWNPTFSVQGQRVCSAKAGNFANGTNSTLLDPGGRAAQLKRIPD